MFLVPYIAKKLFCLKECVEPLQELVEGSVAAEDVLPVESAEGNSNMCFCH